MIAQQSVYLNAARTHAVPENHPAAKFLLVRVGTDVDEKTLAQYGGAVALANSEAKKQAPAPAPAETGGNREETQTLSTRTEGTTGTPAPAKAKGGRKAKK